MRVAERSDGEGERVESGTGERRVMRSVAMGAGSTVREWRSWESGGRRIGIRDGELEGVREAVNRVMREVSRGGGEEERRAERWD